MTTPEQGALIARARQQMPVEQLTHGEFRETMFALIADRIGANDLDMRGLNAAKRLLAPYSDIHYNRLMAQHFATCPAPTKLADGRCGGHATGVAAMIGKWPGTETEADVQAALEKLS